MTDSANDLDLPACKSLVLAGLPGSGKTTLKMRLCGVLENNGVDWATSARIPWAPLSMIDFHTEHAKSEIRKGNLLRSASYWGRLYRTLKANFDLLDKVGVSWVLSGTFLTKELRHHFLSLSENFYIVWLKVSPDVAKERLDARMQSDENAFFQPNWIDRYLEIAEIPVPLDQIHPSRGLLPTQEERVFLLDADNVRLGQKTTFVCNGIPKLRDRRMRVAPDSS